MLPDNNSHTHKVRVVGDIMIVNVEKNDRHFLRKGEKIPAAPRAAGREARNARRPTPKSPPNCMSRKATCRALTALSRARLQGRRLPHLRHLRPRATRKMLVHHRTHGFGMHRFDMDERYAYISTEMQGYVGNILVVYDIKDPAKPEEVSRWWMPGQHVAGGEKPTWRGYSHRLHHAMRFGNEFWASVWFAGMRVLDCSDITQAEGHRRSTTTIRRSRSRRIPSCRCRTSSTAGAMPPPWTRSTTISRGQPHAGLWFFDVEDIANIKPVGDVPSAGTRLLPSAARPRASARISSRSGSPATRIFCTWFSGRPAHDRHQRSRRAPNETGWYIPEPAAGLKGPATNDVFVDKRELIYIIDRDKGFDIIERHGRSGPVAARRQI